MPFRRFSPTFLALIAFPSLVSVAQCWKHSTYVDLSFPPVSKQVHREELGPVNIPGYPNFDCSRIPLDESIKRTPFPTTGGWLELNLVNLTGDLPGATYHLQSLIGQITGDNTTNQTKWVSPDVEVYKNFATGKSCFADGDQGINATNLVNIALAESTGDNGDVPGEVRLHQPLQDITGKNATIEVRIALFNGLSETEEIMIQCAYVNFVSPADFANSNVGGVCNNERSRSSLMAPTATPSPTQAPTGIPTLTTAVPTHSHVSSQWIIVTATTTALPPMYTPKPLTAASIGIPVGATMGAAALVLIVGWLILARRYKKGKTLPLNFFLGFGRSQKPAGDEEGGRKKTTAVAPASPTRTDSESGSIRSEQLPSYQDATRDQELEEIKGMRSGARVVTV